MRHVLFFEREMLPPYYSANISFWETECWNVALCRFLTGPVYVRARNRFDINSKNTACLPYAIELSLNKLLAAMTNLEYELFWYKIAILFYTNYWIVTLTLFILPPLCFSWYVCQSLPWMLIITTCSMDTKTFQSRMNTGMYRAFI